MKRRAPAFDALEEHVTSAEIAEAQALAAEWWEKHNN